jgi:hypothetical protein
LKALRIDPFKPLDRLHTDGEPDATLAALGKNRLLKRTPIALAYRVVEPQLRRHFLQTVACHDESHQ